MEGGGVTFTPEKLKAFKKELAKHPDKDAVFIFEGKQWVVAYARYLVEYLDGVFKTKHITGLN
jgi:hypothetical protein